MIRRLLFRAAAALGLTLAAAAGLCAQVWTPAGNLPIANWAPAFAAVLANGKVLVAGGVILAPGQDQRYATNAEIYNPATGQFTATGSLHASGAGQAAVALQDGRVLVIGGDQFVPSSGGSPPEEISDAPEIYDPATGQFTVLQSVNGSPLPVASSLAVSESGPFVATLLGNGKVLITGGPDGDAHTDGGFSLSPSQAYLFDPKTNTFSDAGATGAVPDGGPFSQVLLPDGDVLVVGGLLDDGSTSPDAPAQIYHVATNIWQTIPTPELPEGPMVWGAALVVLPNGTVLVAGGGDCCIDQDGVLAWIFDPKTETFTPTNGYPLFGLGGSAFLLPNGTALIAAQYDEIYDPSSGRFSQAGVPPFSVLHAQLADGSVLDLGGIATTPTYLPIAPVLRFTDTPNPFTISLPASASLPTGFGSVPITATAQSGFAGVLAFGPVIMSTRVPSVSVSPNPVAAGQTAQLDLSLLTGEQLGVITAASGIYSYWARIVLTGPGLAIGAVPANQTVKAGASAQYTIALGSLDSFPPALTCAGVPQYAACQFSNPNPVLDATGARHVTLTISTQQTAAASGGSAAMPPTPGGGTPSPPDWAALWLAAAWLAVLAFAARARAWRRLRLTALALVFAATLACGGSPAPAVKQPPPPPAPTVYTTPPGTYTITVQAQYNPGPPLQNFDASTQIQLTVQ